MLHHLVSNRVWYFLTSLLLTAVVWSESSDASQRGAATSSGAATSAGTTENAWIQLFNGRDIDDWIVKIKSFDVGENYGETFRVVDGLLQVRYDQYKGPFRGRFGHLFYKTPFSHYLLRVEYRIVGDQYAGAPGWAIRNSGVMIHGQTPETMEKMQDFPVSAEVQLLGGDGTNPRTTGNLCTPGTNVVMDDKLILAHCTSSTSKTYHGNPWVTVEVEVRGNGIIRHKIDGETVLEYSQTQLDERDKYAKKLLAAGSEKKVSGGTISLQSEGHPIEFRKVELKILPE